MLEMLQATLFTTAETVCNQLLKRDPVTLQHLERLTGKVIAIECTSPALNLYLLPNANGLQIQSVYNDEPTTTLRGNAADFITLLTSKDKSDAMFGKTVQVSGDSALATRFQQILSDAQIDWEAMLGDVIGDLPAHQVALYTAWKAQWYKNSASSFIHNLDEFVKEEVRFIPTRPEMDLFTNEVEQLQERAERLAARVEQTLAKHKA